ncbi:WD40 repeat domain-containing protein [Sphingobacterium sp. HJSM2_6]|uniref:WD40 repeat domain-containing protein n=1 Tax=Sphingobacterium sp. HJSM2_6 TaxID=3366264 RepID=UPI003BC9232A
MTASFTNIELESTLKGHQQPIFTVAISSDQRSLYSGGNDKGVVEWDLETMSFKRILCKVNSSVYALSPIPDQNILLIGMRSGQLLVVDTEKQTLLANLKTEQGAIFAIQVIPQKEEIIAVGEEGYAYVWSLKTYDLLYRFRVSDSTARVIALNKQGNLLAIGDKKGVIQLLNAHDFQQVNKQQIHELPVTSLSFHQNQLYSGGRDAKLFQLNENLQVIKSIIPHMFTVYGIVHQEQLPYFITVSRDKSMKIWNEENLSLLKNISKDRGYDSHSLSINTVLWSKDRIFTVSDDKLIKVWKLQDQQASLL